MTELVVETEMTVEFIRHQTASGEGKSVVFSQIGNLGECLEKCFALLFGQGHTHSGYQEIAGMGVALLKLKVDALHAIGLYHLFYDIEQYGAQSVLVGQYKSLW